LNAASVVNGSAYRPPDAQPFAQSQAVAIFVLLDAHLIELAMDRLGLLFPLSFA
jgi:hypothetical protein